MGNNYRTGALTDEEKSKIEALVRFEGYTDIALKLNRSPSTIRKYCQRNGITKDKVSVQKRVDEKARRSPHFEELSNILTEREMDLAVKIYTELMKQFGGDILPSEEIQVIDFCIVSALLNRALAREKQLVSLIDDQTKLRAKLEKDRAKITEDDDDEAMDDWYEKVEQVDIRIASLSDELKEVKKNQLSFLERKDRNTRALNMAREQRADEISKMNENWADFILYVKKNPDFRKKVGYDMEKMRIGIKEEFIRLSELHEFADGELDYPILNSEVIEAEMAKKKYEKLVEEFNETKDKTVEEVNSEESKKWSNL